MAGTQKRHSYFLALSSTGKRQTARNVALANEDLDEQHRATVTVGDQVEFTPVYDCGEQDETGETINLKYKRITISYVAVTAKIIAMWIAYFLGGSSNPTGTSQNERQTVQTDADAGAAPFTFNFEGVSATTEPIPFDATAAEFKERLENLESIGEGNIVSVTGANFAAGFLVEFGGALKRADLPLLTAGAGFTDGGNPVAPTITQTQAGGNKKHPFTRAIADALALTSAATGFDVAEETIEKIKNIGVTDIVITINKQQPISMEVTAIAGFVTSDEPDFEVPECVVIDALEGAKTRLKMIGNWVTDKLWNHVITLSNNVPLDAQTVLAFNSVTKDIQIQERGEKPTATSTIQLLGSKGDAEYDAAEARQVVATESHIGDPGDRVSFYFPQNKLRLNSRNDFVSTLNQSAYTIGATAYKDGANPPFRAEAILDQTEQFLST